VHFSQKLLLSGALFGGGLLVIGGAKQLTAHHLSTGLGVCPYSRAISLRFLESTKALIPNWVKASNSAQACNVDPEP
jgi:hypothetical protein